MPYKNKEEALRSSRVRCRRYYYRHLAEQRARSKAKRQRVNSDPVAREKALAVRRRRHHERYYSDPVYRLRFNLRNLCSDALRRGYVDKGTRSVELLGCTGPELK